MHTRNLVLTTQFGRNKGAGIFPGLFLLLLSGSSSLFIIWCFFRFCCDPTIFFIPYYAFVRYYYHYHFMILGCFVSLKEQLLIFSRVKILVLYLACRSIFFLQLSKRGICLYIHRLILLILLYLNVAAPDVLFDISNTHLSTSSC